MVVLSVLSTPFSFFALSSGVPPVAHRPGAYSRIFNGRFSGSLALGDNGSNLGASVICKGVNINSIIRDDNNINALTPIAIEP